MNEKEIIEKHAVAGNKVVNTVYQFLLPLVEAGEALYTMLQMNRAMQALKLEEQKKASQPATPPQLEAVPPAQPSA